MSKRKDLTIIQMNDTHGYLQEHWEHFFEGSDSNYIRAGGYPRISAYINKVRKEKDNKVVVLDGGDTFHGTLPVVDSKGMILTSYLNEMKIDAMTAHWEFAYGPKHFSSLLNALNYPMLAINCYDKTTDKLVFDPYLIKEVNGLKIGIIGIAATIIDKTMPQHFAEGLYFSLGNEELPGYIAELKDQDVDLVILLSHLGFPQEVKLAQEVDGIDVLLSAHTHNRVYEPALVNDTIIFQSGCHGSFLGHLDLVVENKKIVDYKHQLVVLDESLDEDLDMKAAIEKDLEPYKEQLNKIVGRTGTDLNRSTVFESTMDNLLLQSMIDISGAELAFSNGWRYGAPIPKGDIRENDLWNMIPVNPPLSKVKLKGQEVWDMMEENLERTFSIDPYQQMGGYVKRVLGMNLYCKIENPYGERVQQIFVQGQALEKDRVYHVVFVTSQGVPEKYGHDRVNLDIHAIDVLKEYLSKHEVVSAPLRGSIVAV